MKKSSPSMADRRRGMTLVEVMIFVALGSVVMGTIGIMLSGMWRVQRAMSDYRIASSAIGQLAEQLRSDIHSASEVRIIPISGAHTLQIDRPDNQSIEYRSEKTGIERILIRGGAIVQRESYLLPAGSIAEWSIVPFETGELLTAVLKYPLNNLGQDDKANYREFRIEAAIGIAPPPHSPSQGEAGRG